jgi:7-carboxy-7-deazaguanine synthase
VKISEVFMSLQGEGPHIGKPAIFIRLAGCNLGCVWCDSKFASRNEQTFEVGHEDILNIVTKYAPCKHIVWTGGEPLLQALELQKTIKELKEREYFQEMETNGTISPFPLNNLINSWNVSPKLLSSGIAYEKRIVPDAMAVWTTLIRNVTFKFAVSSPEDLHEVAAIGLRFGIPEDQIMLMPVMVDADREMMAWLAEICKKSGLRFSPRLHLMIWGKRRGV